MSYPILYNATETNFDHNGIGILSACVSCEATEEANGIFELAMTYPMDGVHFAEIGDRAIVKAKADQFRDPQLFRVYAISKPMNGIVTVLAEHISYDLSGIPVKPFSAPTASSALSMLKSNAVVYCPFDFWTDKATQANFKVSVPASIRSRLGGVAGSIFDVYGGEYEFDNYTVKLHNNRGQNRGVSIRYGKNLTDIQQDQNCSNVATGVYPYWVDSEGAVLVELPEKIVNAPGTYNFVKIRTLDLSSEFETQPTVEQLRSKTESYIKANNIGVPSVSLTVSFAQLEQTEEYKHLKLLERVSLFDTVNVEFPALGVSATARAVKIVYDGLADRVKSVTLGSVRANIADTIATQQQEIQQTPTKSDLKRAQEAATAWLTNGKGYKVERRDDLGRVIDTLYMDTPDIETAVNIMRVGQSGIGFSHNGVNGPYESAWTIDGKFNADWITAGTIYGMLIKAGVITSADGTVHIDLDNNKVVVDTIDDYGSNGKIEIDASGIIGYGWDSDADDFVSTLRIATGSQGGGSARLTTITSLNSSGGLSVAAAKVGAALRLGASGVDTQILGNVSVKYTPVAWLDVGGAKLLGREGDTVSIGSGKDHITSQGASGNWRYRIWNSGFKECWLKKPISGLALTSSWGSLYESGQVNVGTLPITFSSMPTAFMTYTSNPGNSMAWPEGLSAVTTNYGGHFYLCRATSAATTSGYATLYYCGV